MRKLLLLVLTFALMISIAFPAPRTIDASSVVTPKTMVFFLDCDFAYINGGRIPVGGTPFSKQSNVMLPLRFLIQQIGGTFTLEPESKTIKINYGGKEISISTNANLYTYS